MTCLVFGGDRYYPSGGIEDLIGAAPTWAGAIAIAASRNVDWWQVVNLENGDYCTNDGRRDDIVALRGLRVGADGHVPAPIIPTHDEILMPMVDAGVPAYWKAEEVWRQIVSNLGAE